MLNFVLLLLIILKVKLIVCYSLIHCNETFLDYTAVMMHVDYRRVYTGWTQKAVYWMWYIVVLAAVQYCQRHTVHTVNLKIGQSTMTLFTLHHFQMNH